MINQPGNSSRIPRDRQNLNPRIPVGRQRLTQTVCKRIACSELEPILQRTMRYTAVAMAISAVA